MDKPTGTVTFIFTDIEGSTKLSQQFAEAYPAALERHHVILRTSIEANNGYVFRIVGDAFCCAFSKAEDAVKAAIDIQLNLTNEDWGEVVIKIRIGIHTGAAEWNGERYMGYITLARTARVMSTGYGEQIIISNDTYELCRDKFDAVKEKDVSFRDLGERRLKDVIQPIRLYQIISPGLREDFPPLKTLDSRPNNLPVQLTSFIGREDVMEQVKELFNQTHLLTIIGFGGGGKTRLSMQVGADMIDDFNNGVFIAELAPVSDPSMVVQTIMNSLEVKEEPGKSLEETLTNYLKDKELLLILDNCEHLVNECAELCDVLLGKCPKLKIIATSREALNCAGEQTFIIPPLKLPDASKDNTPEQLTQYESVRLFIERALSVSPNFRVTNTNAPALAEICNRLDGIPLAIELAAARVKVLSLEKIYERLNDRFSLLTGGRRTALPRQQTLRAMIDWSYDLLSEKERTLWNRLSVFQGGWTLEAAEEICSDEKVKQREVLDLLIQLAEKSIIIYDEENERYRILETMKQYGEEKLIEEKEQEIVLDKHLKCFAELVESGSKKLRGTEHLHWISIMDTESGNFEKAILRAVESSNINDGFKIVGSLSYYWQLRGHISEAIRWLEEITKKVPEVIDATYCKIISHKGNFYRFKSDFEKAGKFLRESLNLSREIGDEIGVTDTLNRMGIYEFDRGRFEEAAKYYEENLEIFRKNGDKMGISKTLNNLGNASSNLGDDDRAMKLYEESLGLRRELSDRLGIAITSNNIGILAFERGEFERADELLEESVQVRREMGDMQGIAISAMNLGSSLYNQGKYENATVLYDESARIYDEMGDLSGLSESLYNLGKVEFARGEIEKAEDYFKRGLQISSVIKADSFMVINLFGLGKTASQKNEYEKARQFYRESFKLYQEMGNRKDIDLNLLWMSELCCRVERYSDAARLLGFIEREFLERKKILLPKSDQIIYDETLGTVNDHLGEEEFSQCFEAGKVLNFEQVIELAMSV